MKFKNDIELQAGLEDLSGSTGTSGQLLSSTATGTSWVDQSDISAGNAEHVVVYAKNTHTASIAKGTPVYITGTVGATDTVEIAPADASDSAKMPAVGLLDETLAVNAFGYVITGGFMDNITTDPIDGATPSSNDTVYVKAGGGLTLTKPTGPTGLIQNVAKVGKVSGGNSGSLIVSSILRTNDVPNLTTGKIWVGDGNTVESTVVHLDEVNGRMGIGTTSPSDKLQVNQGSDSFRGITIEGTSPALYLKDTQATNAYHIGANGNYLYFLEDSNQSGTYNNIMAYWDPSNNFIFKTGNVGIGTTSPGAKLDIVGSTIGLRIKKPDLSDVLRVYTQGSGVFVNNGNFHVEDNVGIGTTSPGEALTVKTKTEAYFPGIKIEDYNSSMGLYVQNIEGENSGIGTGRYYNSGNWRSDVTAPTTIRLDGGAIRFYAQSGVTADTNYTPTQRMTINADGNVGIGTTNPGKKLHVTGDTYIEESGTGQTLLLGRTNGQPTIKADDSNGGHMIIDSYSNFMSLNHYISQNVVLVAGGGNVGIGTTSPSYKLDVAGDIRVDSTSVAQIFLDSAASNDAVLNFHENASQKGKIGYDTSLGGIALVAGSGSFSTADMVLLDGGNVGIGTTSPAKKLHVKESTTATYAAYIENSIAGGDYLAMIGDAGDNVFEFDSGGTGGEAQMKMYSDGVLKNLLNANGSSYFTGNVGIGTTSPSYKLSIAGPSSAQLEIINSSNSKSWRPNVNGNDFYITETGVSNPFVIQAGGNVGIGTTSPSGRLNIQSSAVSTYLLNLDYANGTDGGGFYEATSTDLSLFLKNSSGTNTVTIATDGDSYFNGGNVGIGTTSPSEKLHVFGGAAAIEIDSTTNEAALKYDNSTTTATIKLANNDLKTELGGSEKMRITSAGNVGIGTTSPSNKLQVSGGSIGIDSEYMIRDNRNNTILLQSASTAASNRSLTIGNATYSNIIIPNGNVGIGTTSPSQKLTVEGNIELGTGGFIYGDTTTSYLRLNNAVGSLLGYSNAYIGLGPSFVYNVGGSEKFRISSATGNVGIGTTSPYTQLQVGDSEQTTSAVITIASRYGSSNPYLNFRSGHSANSNVWNMASIHGDDDGNYNGKLEFRTANSGMADPTIKMIIKANGNVGIGTTSPQKKLDVYLGTNDAVASIGGTISSGEYAGLHFGYSETGNSLYRHSAIVFERDDSSFGDARGKIHLLNSASGSASADLGDARLTILPNGNVGIGTANPSTKLHVAGIAQVTESGNSAFYGGNYLRVFNNQVYTMRNSSGNQRFAFDNTSGSLSTYNSSNIRTTYFNNSGSSYINGGNVGIGTTSPLSKLHVSGGDIELDDGYEVRFNVTGTVTAEEELVLDAGNTDSKIILEGADSAMKFITGNSTAIAINDSQNVGIGTTSPANKLDVVGISRFTHSSSTAYRGAIETVTDNAYPTWDIGWLHARTTSSTYGNIARFNNQSGTQIGGIFYSGSSGTSFVTTSDYRLKENIKEISDSISRVKKLKPCRFNFAAEKNKVIDGFIAHEVQEVVPEAVHGEKDALQKDGSIDAQTLEVSRLIPVLTKALQEAINKIEKLELRIQTIENN